MKNENEKVKAKEEVTEKKKEINVQNLNSVIKISKKLLKVAYVIMLLLLLVLITTICQKWHVLQFLGELLAVIAPLFIGFVIAWLVDPIIKRLTSTKMSRAFASVVVYLIILAIFIILAIILTPQLASQIKEFIQSFPNTLKDIKGTIDNLLGMIKDSGINSDATRKEIYGSISKLSDSVTHNLPQYLFNFGKSFVYFAAQFGLGIIVAFYLSTSFNKVHDKIRNFFPEKWHDDYNDLTKKINTTLRGYVSGVLMVMFLVFISQSIGLTLAGLKAPLVFALFCAITDVIPYFGPWIGGIPAVIVGFTISPTVGICTIISILVVQALENYFYQPLIMGHTMKLHPITIMIGLLIFGHFFGIIGMIIATPVIACLKILFEFIYERKAILKKLKI